MAERSFGATQQLKAPGERWCVAQRAPGCLKTNAHNSWSAREGFGWPPWPWDRRTPGGTSSGFDRSDSSSLACGEKGRRIDTRRGFDQPRIEAPSAASISNFFSPTREIGLVGVSSLSAGVCSDALSVWTQRRVSNECVMTMTGLLIRRGSIKGSGGNAGMLCPRAPPELPILVVTLGEDGRGEAEMPPGRL